MESITQNVTEVETVSRGRRRWRQGGGRHISELHRDGWQLLSPFAPSFLTWFGISDLTDTGLEHKCKALNTHTHLLERIS